MKKFIYILLVLTIGLVIYNLTQVNFTTPFEGESIVALITVMAGLCGILLLTILLVSKKIEKIIKRKS